AVTEQNDVADRPVDHQLVEEVRPLVFTAVKVDRVRKPPERAVAGVEIDPMHRMPAGQKRPTEAVEKPRRQPLQKEKAATGGRTAHHRPPAFFAAPAKSQVTDKD